MDSIVKKEWRNSIGKLDRVGGPAKILMDGTEMWYRNSELHRVGGPAVIRKTRCCMLFAKLFYKYRTDGPATFIRNGNKVWSRHGEFYRTNGLPVEYDIKECVWYSDDEYGNGPKFTHTCFTKEWYCHNKRHRVDGPAIEYADGSFEWFVNGVRVTTEKKPTKGRIHMFCINSVKWILNKIVSKLCYTLFLSIV